MRVLVLEYDAILCDSILLALQRNGFEAIRCKDPQTINEVIEKVSPDVLILDNHLQKMNGIDLLTNLKGEGLLQDVYVIFISSLGFSPIVKQAVNAGANEFLVKPFNLDLLISKIKTLDSGSKKKKLSTDPQDS